MKTIACLAGDGVGPELMAAATRALDRVAELHSLQLDDVHLPFGGEARDADGASAAARDPRRLPRTSTRSSSRRPTTRRSKASRPTWSSPGASPASSWTAAAISSSPGRSATGATGLRSRRAFSSTAARRGRVLCVGESPDWRAAVEAERARWSGLEVEEASLAQALVRLREQPGSLDVVVTESHLVEAMVDTAAHFAGLARVGRPGAGCPNDGPGVFFPGASEPDDVAGFGVVDPRGMLLTASLMLAEGLKRRSASRTLERAVDAAARRDAPVGRGHAVLHRRRDRPAAAVEGRPGALRRGVGVTRGARMLGSDAILRSLEAEGVDVMFGIPGGAILPTYDAIARGTTVRHVLARHEQGAGHMAEGYARASGKVGVAIATSGPGRDEPRDADRRRVDGLDAARLHHRPGARRTLIGTDAFQETDATGITMPIVKHSWLVQDVARAAAAYQGRVPRRPHRPSRPGARRRRQGRAGGRARLLLPGRRRPARLEAADEGSPERQVREAARGDRRGAAADRLRRRRRAQRRRLRRAARARRGRRSCPRS